MTILTYCLNWIQNLAKQLTKKKLFPTVKITLLSLIVFFNNLKYYLKVQRAIPMKLMISSLTYLFIGLIKAQAQS